MATDSKHETHETTTVETTSERPRTGIILTVAALIIILAGVGVFFAWKKKKNNNKEVTQSAEDIRNTFAPPASSTPTFIPPLPDQNQNNNGTNYNNTSSSTITSIPPLNTNSNSGANSNYNNNNSTHSNNNYNDNYNTPVLNPARTYSNASLGFQMDLPAGWAVQENGNKIFFYNQTSGAQQGYVEVYDNNGTDLGTLEKMLAGSPSVTGISHITLNGQEALKYSTNNSWGSGIALLNANKIYYIHGPLINTGVGSSFRGVANASNNNYQNNAANGSTNSQYNYTTGNNSSQNNIIYY